MVTIACSLDLSELILGPEQLMAYEHMNRADRRAMAVYARTEAAKRPAKLTEIPRERFSTAYRFGANAPTHAWESREFLAQMYDVDPFQGIDTRRLSVCRVTLKDDGHWEENLSWEELMRVKREIGFGDWYAVEIYPRDSDIVNVANMRHLWILAAPLGLGWFSNNPDRHQSSATAEHP